MVVDDRPTRVRYWVALILVALAIRLVVAFVLFGHLTQQSDALSYVNQARDILAGRYEGKAFFWPVGRSVCLIPFLFAFGASEAVIKANCITIDVACVIMAALLGHQVLRRRSTARLVGWIAAFYVPMALASNWCYSENAELLFLLTFSCLTIAACRHVGKGGLASLGAWFASGCALGLAILTRPSSQSVLAACLAGCVLFTVIRYVRPGLFSAAWLVSWRTIAAAGLLFAIGVSACVVPVLRHNASAGAGWFVSTNNERNLFLGNNPYTPNYKTWHWGQHPIPESAPPEMKAYFSSFYKAENPRSAMIHETIRYIKERPDIFLLRTLNRIRAFWGFDYEVAGIVEGQWPACGKVGVLAILAAEASAYALVMLLVIAGLFMFSKEMELRYALFLIAVVLAYQLPYALAFGNGSYHPAVIGFVFPFAAVAIGQARLGRTGGWRQVLASKWFWIAVLGFVLVQLEYAYHVASFHHG
jgi:hypothetical protein